MSKRFYITTAIDYVNGQPHLGHAYEKIVADVIARARRSLGEEVFFLTGLDEHGQKVQQAAHGRRQKSAGLLRRAGRDLAGVRRTNSALTNDDFVRTTEPRHKEVVQAILSKLHADGPVLQGDLQGLLFDDGGNIFDGERPPARRHV